MERIQLNREELISVIEGKGTTNRIPMMYKFWTDAEEFEDRKDKVNELIREYPEDVQAIPFLIPEVCKGRRDDPEYRWVNYEVQDVDESTGIDEKGALDDWSKLPGILENFPDSNYKGMFPSNPNEDGRYRLGYWWYCLFERHWQLRGMTNALMDYYIEPENVHKLFRALTDFYLVMIERAKKELNIDGVLLSDDLGTQKSTFFSQEIFDEFYKPYYKELIDKAHEVGLHFWLHSCGNIERYIPDFIELKLDVLHPIQKYTMNQKSIAEKYGNNICIWAGFDVQQTIPWGTPEKVRKEVRNMIDTYYNSNGRFMLTAGNGITGDCKLDSLEALYNETYIYGIEKIKNMK